MAGETKVSASERTSAPGRGTRVLLFYDGYELQAEPGFTGAIYAQTRRAARYVYRTLRRTQVWTGFYTAFRSLRQSLERYGCEVHVNNFGLARLDPSYPIGLAGYPSILSKLSLPNPLIFGPGDYGFPDAAASFAREPRVRRLIQPSEWAADLYRPYCGDKMLVWPVGIDTDTWADATAHPKSIDFVVYDKIRWFREREVPRVLQRVTSHLEKGGYSYRVLRYGEHHLSQFSRLLRQSRAMIFLCEHETQGLAYQEAMACNVPILAWDEGILVDPQQQRFIAPGLSVSSVPYFDARCGERFKLPEFEAVFAEFVNRLGRYRPREYVVEHLSLTHAARAYLEAYTSCLPHASRPSRSSAQPT